MPPKLPAIGRSTPEARKKRAARMQIKTTQASETDEHWEARGTLYAGNFSDNIVRNLRQEQMGVSTCVNTSIKTELPEEDEIKISMELYGSSVSIKQEDPLSLNEQIKMEPETTLYINDNPDHNKCLIKLEESWNEHDVKIKVDETKVRPYTDKTILPINEIPLKVEYMSCELCRGGFTDEESLFRHNLTHQNSVPGIIPVDDLSTQADLNCNPLQSSNVQFDECHESANAIYELMIIPSHTFGKKLEDKYVFCDCVFNSNANSNSG